MPAQENFTGITKICENRFYFTKGVYEARIGRIRVTWPILRPERTSFLP